MDLAINRPFGDLGHLPLESIDGSGYCLVVNIDGATKIPSFYKLDFGGTLFKLSIRFGLQHKCSMVVIIY